MKKLLLMITLCMWSLPAMAEEPTPCWVLCQPDSYVNVRAKPSKKAEVIGYMDVGMKLKTDGKTKHGYLHVIDMSLEQTDGWIHTGYIVYSEPKELNTTAKIVSYGRVKARKCVDGARRCWLQSGSTLTVYWMCGEWGVTSKGFVMRDYLEVQ